MGSLLAGGLVFSIQDAIIKALSGEHAVTLAIFVRAIVALPVLLAMVHFECGLKGLLTGQWRMMLLRGGILLCSYTSYFMAFPALPLAEAIALYFMVPLIVTLLAGPMLGEKVTPAAWAAVAIGLVGVFVILQPGSGLFNPAALLSLISAATYAFAMVLARRYGSNTPSSVLSFYQNVVYGFGAAGFAGLAAVLGIKPPGHPSIDFLFRAWAWPSLHDAVLMGLCGVIAAVGMNLLTHAYRKGQANIVAPFEYVGMIWAIVFGFTIFGEVPKASTLAGMGMIAFAGILALRAGVKAGKKSAAKA
ncbi:MAG: EamA family transporter [Alphaproteobacteria bacterium]|nr:EamA family transporter [Alphaproteobacteria bacterium]